MATNVESTNPYLPPPGSLAGYVAMVTGATSGIGLETAAALAQAGARVIFAVRNKTKAENTAKAIKQRVGGNIDLVYPPAVPAVDFLDSSSIRTFANAILQRGEPLHILVNNAGASRLPNFHTQDGVASLAQANYLGPWLLNRILEPLLISSKTRVVFVSSLTARTCVLPPPLTFLTSWHHTWYKHTKLAQVLHAYQMTKRLRGFGVTVCAVDPGGVNTAIWSNNIFAYPPFKQIINTFYAPADDAAKIVLHAACIPWHLEDLPELGPQDAVRFYARGMTTSPVVSYWDGAFANGAGAVRWTAWCTLALVHSLIDYPVRDYSGGRMASKLQVVPTPKHGLDDHTAQVLWELSERFAPPTEGKKVDGAGANRSV